MADYLFFDLDGTLTDPFEGISNSILHALDRMGKNKPERSSLRRFIGPPLTGSFRSFLGMTEEKFSRHGKDGSNLLRIGTWLSYAFAQQNVVVLMLLEPVLEDSPIREGAYFYESTCVASELFSDAPIRCRLDVFASARMRAA